MTKCRCLCVPHADQIIEQGKAAARKDKAERKAAQREDKVRKSEDKRKSREIKCEPAGRRGR